MQNHGQQNLIFSGHLLLLPWIKKEMNTTEIALMDDRNIATRMRMHKVEAEQEWTEMIVDAIDFDVELPASLFTHSNLRNPRQ